MSLTCPKPTQSWKLHSYTTEHLPLSILVLEKPRAQKFCCCCFSPSISAKDPETMAQPHAHSCHRFSLLPSASIPPNQADPSCTPTRVGIV